MYNLTITEMDGYRYLVDFGHKIIADQFKLWFQSSTTNSEHNRQWDSGAGKYVGKRSFWKELVPHYESIATKEVEDSQVVILRGMLDWLIWWKATGPGKEMGLSFNPMDYMSMEKPFLRYPEQHPSKLKLHLKWENIFRGHPRGQFYVDAQLKAWDCLTSSPHSAIELGTGLGKTELILALVDHLVGGCKPEDGSHPLGDDFGNVAILVPGNAIREEIYMRAFSLEEAQAKGLESVNHWDVPMEWNIWTPDNHINIINPVGFLNSKNAMNPQAIMWLRNVRWVIIDEAHKLSSDSYERLFQDYMINVVASKAVSGTLDKLEGRYLHPAQCNVASMQPCNAQVVGYSGACRISEKVEVDTSITEIRSDVSDPDAYQKVIDWEERTAKEAHFLEKLNCMIDAPKFPDLLHGIWRHLADKYNDERTALYVPFYGKENNLELCEKIHKLFSIDVCYWASGSVILNGELVGSGVEDVKKLGAAKKYQILFSSSVAFEGADIKGLRGIVSLVGTNNSRVKQTIGRSARMDHLDIYLISDDNNPLVKRQTKSRLKRILPAYNVEKFEKLDWRGNF